MCRKGRIFKVNTRAASIFQSRNQGRSLGVLERGGFPIKKLRELPYLRCDSRLKLCMDAWVREGIAG